MSTAGNVIAEIKKKIQDFYKFFNYVLKKNLKNNDEKMSYCTMNIR
jgi:hypothetical protein